MCKLQSANLSYKSVIEIIWCTSRDTVWNTSHPTWKSNKHKASVQERWHPQIYLWWWIQGFGQTKPKMHQIWLDLTTRMYRWRVIQKHTWTDTYVFYLQVAFIPYLETFLLHSLLTHFSRWLFENHIETLDQLNYH